MSFCEKVHWGENVTKKKRTFFLVILNEHYISQKSLYTPIIQHTLYFLLKVYHQPTARP